MTRKLASVQKVVKIEPIEGADRIEKCTIEGWEVVVAKSDQFQPDQLVVYFEVDSIVPPKPEFQFLEDRKYRIRTIKLRKQVSQGLVLPLSILPKKNWKEGDDVTEILGVTKYDPQGDLERRLAEEAVARSKNKIKKFLMQYPWWRKLFLKPKRGNWPKFIQKTDEERIQNLPHICENEKDTTFQFTEKLDGCSATYFILKQPKHKFLWWNFGTEFVFGVCSRNLHLPKENDKEYWAVARQFNIKNSLLSIFSYEGAKELVVLQGEILGEGIQKNKYGIKGFDFYAYNLIIDGKKLDNFSMHSRLNTHWIKSVPLLTELHFLPPTIPDCVELSKGKSLINPSILREGLVVRNYEKGLSFKIINPDFLLKFEDA
jgi:hypothetical protein